MPIPSPQYKFDLKHGQELGTGVATFKRPEEICRISSRTTAEMGKCVNFETEPTDKQSRQIDTDLTVARHRRSN